MSTTTIYGQITDGGGVVEATSSKHVLDAHHESVGVYRVQIDPVFKHPPVVVATLLYADPEDPESGCGGGTNRTISVNTISETEFCVGIRKAKDDNERDDRPFNFVAVGESA